MSAGARIAEFTKKIEPAVVTNAAGQSRYFVLCDHASNHIPPAYNALGLTEDQLERHIAWDPGALPVAQRLAQNLDALLVHATVSRLVIDLNRTPNAPDLIAASSEDTAIPGNVGLTAEEQTRRIATFYDPYHRTIEKILEQRVSQKTPTALIAIHTYTPVFRGNARPWHVGVVHDGDNRLASKLIAHLSDEPNLVVGDNEPYSPADGVYHTLERHKRPHDLASVMIEIRSDLVANAEGQKAWAARLTQALNAIDVPTQPT